MPSDVPLGIGDSSGTSISISREVNTVDAI